MLRRPSGWNSCSTRYVVKELLLQADAIDQYPEASRAFTRASLEFMLSGPRWAARQSAPGSLVHQPARYICNAWHHTMLPVEPRQHAAAWLGLSVGGDSCHLEDVLAEPLVTNGSVAANDGRELEKITNEDDSARRAVGREVQQRRQRHRDFVHDHGIKHLLTEGIARVVLGQCAENRLCFVDDLSFQLRELVVESPKSLFSLCDLLFDNRELPHRLAVGHQVCRVIMLLGVQFLCSVHRLFGVISRRALRLSVGC